MPIPTNWIPTEWVDERLKVLGAAIATQLQGDINTLEQNLENKIDGSVTDLKQVVSDAVVKMVQDVVAGAPAQIIQSAGAIATALAGELHIPGLPGFLAERAVPGYGSTPPAPPDPTPTPVPGDGVITEVNSRCLNCGQINGRHMTTCPYARVEGKQ